MKRSVKVGDLVFLDELDGCQDCICEVVGTSLMDEWKYVSLRVYDPNRRASKDKEIYHVHIYDISEEELEKM